MKQVYASIISNTEIMPGVNLMWFEAPDIAATAQPGQFVTVSCGDLVLRRPFSIHQVNLNLVALLFKVVGKGTLWLSQRREGDKMDILGSLGKGFSIEPGSRNLLLVAGGIGIAPFAFLLQHVSHQHGVRLIYGASTASGLYSFSLLPSEVQFVPVTEDGSIGRKGLASDILPEFLDWADQVYACGPVGMYKAMSKQMSSRAQRSNLKLKKCQVSLELRMGCGIGACYGCSINTEKGLRKVCRDGPVFELDDILWEEVKI